MERIVAHTFGFQKLHPVSPSDSWNVASASAVDSQLTHVDVVEIHQGTIIQALGHQFFQAVDGLMDLTRDTFLHSQERPQAPVLSS